MIVIKFDGGKAFAQGLRVAANSPRLRRKIGETLTERATKIYDVSQLIVPVSEEGSHGNPPGFLKDSGGVTPLQTRGNFAQVSIEYKARYATYVHEDLFARHKHGQAKFVEKPYLAERRGTLDALLEVLQSELRDIAAAALLAKVTNA